MAFLFVLRGCGQDLGVEAIMETIFRHKVKSVLPEPVGFAVVRGRIKNSHLRF